MMKDMEEQINQDIMNKMLEAQDDDIDLNIDYNKFYKKYASENQ